MSEIINNREQQIYQSNDRITNLKLIFKALHNGGNFDEIKAHFDGFIGKITMEEISNLSNEFLEDEGISIEEVHRMYKEHMELFKGAIEEKEPGGKQPEEQPGHPIHTFKMENRALENLLDTKMSVHLEQFKEEDSAEHVYKLLEDINLLLDVDKHYSRKENLIFPYLEKYGIYGPTNNMWRIDDYIRDNIKHAKKLLSSYQGDKKAVLEVMDWVIEETHAMIYREEHILFQMALDHFTEDEWVKIANESDEIGFCLVEPAVVWNPDRKALDENAISEGYIKMDTGILSLKQLELLLNHLPVDITFIDHEDVVRYFSHGKERIFARTKAVIGRSVQNCHPPRSVHVVEELLADFKSGTKDSEDFWIKFKDKYVYIRYFAVRDDAGNYIGTLEFTQNIDPIKAIDGEKRILS
ncbi:DUF438 domain-containing protein [Neobacillus sp. LXY-1]|uniref:DUF438 domain-containing protein n=1 Tax=Neobacillus sp. LXY-1 TaxID=3379133 RepID=UPI003EE3265F